MPLTGRVGPGIYKIPIFGKYMELDSGFNISDKPRERGRKIAGKVFILMD
jgi:hypothetical protein